MNKEKEKTFPLVLFLIIFCLFLFFLEKQDLGGKLRKEGERITLPIRLTFYQNFLNLKKNLNSLKEKKEKLNELEEKIREVEELKVKLKTLEEENKTLRRQLEAPFPPQIKFLPAKTIGFQRYLIIDKGEEDGITKGMIVVLENVFIGKIIETTPKTSKIILPSDPQSKIPVRTSKTKAQGLVVGEFGVSIILDKVLQSEVLEKDDFVLTVEDFPNNLLIGKIKEIQKKEAEPFQRAKIQPLLDWAKLENVFVIK